MREIKFRAWDTDYHTVSDTDGKPKQKMLGWDRVQDMVMWTFYRRPGGGEQTRYKFMQYTGLKDKNGVEIYEGDIVNRYDDNGEVQDVSEVEWDKRKASFLLSNYKNFSIGTWLGLFGTNRLEVIGNIYENPELLQEAA